MTKATMKEDEVSLAMAEVSSLGRTKEDPSKRPLYGRCHLAHNQIASLTIRMRIGLCEE